MFQNFLRPNLDVLFVGLNPAEKSWDNGHYFSSDKLFWNCLKESEFTTIVPERSIADEVIFGSNENNHNRLNYAITDLFPNIVTTKSHEIRSRYKKEKVVFDAQIDAFLSMIRELKPKVVICMGKDVEKYLKPIIEKSTSKESELYYEGSFFFFTYFPFGNYKAKLVASLFQILNRFDDSIQN